MCFFVNCRFLVVVFFLVVGVGSSISGVLGWV